MADNDEPQTKLSRRDFLKLAGVGLGSLAMRQYLPQSTKSLPEQNVTDETIQIGNLELTPVITEHDEETWEKNGAEILNLLKKYPIIIPEYFPPDFEPHIQKKPMIDSTIHLLRYDTLNFAFTKIADFAKQSNKPVWVVDPAYSEAFVKLRASRNWWMPLLGIVLSTPFVAKTSESIKNFDNSTPQKTAVSAIKTIIPSSVVLATIGSGTFFMGADKDPMSIELDIRHTFIAESLVQLGNQIPSPTQAAIIYPKGHWYGEQKESTAPTKGILYYLQHPDDRIKQFNQYNEMFSGEPTWEDFFKIRNYMPTKNGWQQQAIIELSTSAK